MAGHDKKLGDRHGPDAPLEPSEGTSPEDTLMPHFWTLEQNKLVVNYLVYIICYSSLWKLTIIKQNRPNQHKHPYATKTRH